VSLGGKGLCVFGLQECLCLCTARVFVVLGCKGLCVFELRDSLSFSWKSFCVLPCKGFSVFGMQESVCLWVARMFLALGCKILFLRGASSMCFRVQVSLCLKGLCVFGL
jgi:hypothetical protein